MKKIVFSLLLLLISVHLNADNGRKVSLDKNWKFFCGIKMNAESETLSDASWRTVTLPHDWRVEPLKNQLDDVTVGPFSRVSDGKWDQGQTIGGESWYRKHLFIPASDKGKRLVVAFDGVMNESEVFLNGEKLNFQPYGYTSFRVDITQKCRYGQDNILAVRCVNYGQNSRWYTGSGIFRHVWLLRTPASYLDDWDTYLDGSRVNKGVAEVHFMTVPHDVQSGDEVSVILYAPDGKAVVNATLPVADTVRTIFRVKRPALWSIETPQRYMAHVTLLHQGQSIDALHVPFGIRTISFSATKGFLLNGKQVKLAGGCVHHDNGLLGAAAIDRAEIRRVELLKANGYNAVRCAHNQVSECFLTACDSLGLLVIHETFDQWQLAKRDNDYHQYFDDWSDRDLAASVRRDRNHPSIIMWSIGNEIAQRAMPEGEAIAQRLTTTIRRHDTSRFTTMGVNSPWDCKPYTWEKDMYRAFRNIDVGGYNYEWQQYENDHKNYPERVMYGSETYPLDFAKVWRMVKNNDYIIGDFVWTAIDYLGEAGLAHALVLSPNEKPTQFMDWPWYNAWCGDLDLTGKKKPQSYFRDVVLGRRAIDIEVHAPLPAGKQEVLGMWGPGWSWPNEWKNWNYQEGDTLSVNVYSLAPKVRLYLNNRLIGEQTTNDNITATFRVPFETGVLRAENVGAKGQYDELQSTGQPYAIRLSAERVQVKASHNDAAYVHAEIVDSNGKLVSYATNQLHFKVEGAYSEAIGGNAAPDDMKSFRSLSPKAFRGCALLIVRPSDRQMGNIVVSATADGLQPATVTLQVVSE